MATTADTVTQEKGLTLTPPDPVPTVAPAQAAGLVPGPDDVEVLVALEVGQAVTRPDRDRHRSSRLRPSALRTLVTS